MYLILPIWRKTDEAAKIMKEIMVSIAFLALRHGNDRIQDSLWNNISV